MYFCDPQSPWQRGSNENTNGLLRQYFPDGTDLSTYSQANLNAVARRLNMRPRKTLGYDLGCNEDKAAIASACPCWGGNSLESSVAGDVVQAVIDRCYGFKSSDALPLFGSKGTELCSCVTTHVPSILRKQTVVRHHISSCPPPAFVALTWQRP